MGVYLLYFFANKMHLFNLKFIGLVTYYVPDAVPGAEQTAVNRQTPDLKKLPSQRQRGKERGSKAAQGQDRASVGGEFIKGRGEPQMSHLD